MFLTEMGDRLELAVSALSAGDLPEAVRLVHGAAGTTGICGAAGLAEDLTSIEHLAAAGRADDAQKALGLGHGRVPSPHDGAAGGSPAVKRIIVIEDNVMAASLYQAALTRDGYGVEVASDGEAGLAAIARARPDLVLLDLMLPKVDGSEVLRRIRATPDLATLPVIITSNAYTAPRLEELQAGRRHADHDQGQPVAERADARRPRDAGTARARELTARDGRRTCTCPALPPRPGGRVDHRRDPRVVCGADHRRPLRGMRARVGLAARRACSSGRSRPSRRLRASEERLRSIVESTDEWERAHRRAETTKSDFASFVSHQLRTPLTGVSWMLELAAEAPGLTPDVAGYVDRGARLDAPPDPPGQRPARRVAPRKRQARSFSVRTCDWTISSAASSTSCGRSSTTSGSI